MQTRDPGIGVTRINVPPQDLSLAHDFFLRARSMEMEGKSAVALGYYQVAFRYNSSNRDLCFLLLDRLRDANKTDSAIDLGMTCFELEGKPTSEEYQSMGQAYLQKNDASSAVGYFDKAVKLDDENREALYVLTGLYEQLEDGPHYVETLRKLLPLIEYPPRLVDKLLQSYQTQGKPDSIGPVLQEAWQKSGQPGIGEELAGYYEAHARYPQFLEVSEELSRQNPDTRSYKLLYAEALTVSGMPDSALGLYRDLLDKHPEDHETQFTCAVLLQKQGRFAESYSIFKKLAKSFPQSAMYQYSYGSAGLQLRQPESRTALEKAVSLEPTIPDYWARSIYADRVFGHDSLAAVRLKHLPDGGNPDSWQAAFFRGTVHALLARQFEPHTPEEDSTVLEDSTSARHYRSIAADFYRTALAKSPDNRLVLFELGTNLERLGRRDSATQTLRELVKVDTLNSVALNYLGYMLVEDDTDLDFAGRLLDRALALEPENGAYLDSKGWWDYRMGNFPAARIFMQKSLEHMPMDPTVLDHLATVLDRLGEKEAARATREKIHSRQK